MSTPALTPAVPAPAPPLQRPAATAHAVAIVGLGAAGLPLALAFLDAPGRTVIGLDADAGRREAIRRGHVDLTPRDRDRLRRHLSGGARGFQLTGDPARLADAGAVLICVPAPVDARRGPDLTALRAACAAAVAHAVPGQTLVLTSTVYAGTTRDLLARPLAARGLTPGRDVHVASAPERTGCGTPRRTPATAHRLVGGLTAECGRRAASLLAHTAASVHRVGSPEAAELARILASSARAVRSALASEFADACGSLGLDPAEVTEAAALGAFGLAPFPPGPGAAEDSHRLTRDPQYLLWQLRARRVAAPLADAAVTALTARPQAVARRVLDALAERGRPRRGARVLLVGAARQPGVADVRESPALAILTRLAAEGVRVAYTDPLIPSLTLPGPPRRQLDSEHDPAAGAWDLVLVRTRHPGQDLTWLDAQPAVLEVPAV